MVKKFIFLLALTVTHSLFSLEVSEQVCSENTCYTVIEELGEGAFGKVFLVKDADGQEFAMKTYTYDYDSSFYNDMEREFERGQALDHPNIISTYELFSDDSESYLVLELVRGSCMWGTERKSLTKNEALKAGNKFVDAIRYAHSLGYLHFDLHQGNVMIDSNKEAVIIDLASFFTYEELYKIYMYITGSSSAPSSSMLTYREAKVKKFLSKNPQLVKKMDQVKKSRSLSAVDQYSLIKKYINAAYLDAVSEMNRNIISKSMMDKKQKLKMYSKIKTLSWSFVEDIADGKQPSIEEHFQKLMTVH